MYVDVPSIPAYELNFSYKLNANGQSLGYYSALTYIKHVLTADDSDATLVKTVTAMYHYHQAASCYFINH